MKTNTIDAIKLSPEEQAVLRVMIIRQHEKTSYKMSSCPKFQIESLI
jgi:hypothetical protein